MIIYSVTVLFVFPFLYIYISMIYIYIYTHYMIYTVYIYMYTHYICIYIYVYTQYIYIHIIYIHIIYIYIIYLYVGLTRLPRNMCDVSKRHDVSPRNIGIPYFLCYSAAYKMRERAHIISNNNHTLLVVLDVVLSKIKTRLVQG